jgi:multidrug efflux pump subunit AcrB
MSKMLNCASQIGPVASVGISVTTLITTVDRGENERAQYIAVGQARVGPAMRRERSRARPHHRLFD